jgi:hypothetical protein
MKIEQVYILVPETPHEQRVLQDVVNAHYPVGPRALVGMHDGVFYPCGTFHATEEQMAKVRIELKKTPGQRRAEWMAMRKEMKNEQS